MYDEHFDVVVVGGGNAGFTAATTAAENGARVALVEKAPEHEYGGNTYFTAGAYRYTFDGLEDILPTLSQDDGSKGIDQKLIEKIEMKGYTKDDFLADIRRVTKNRANSELATVLVENSRDAVRWISDNGGKWHLSFHRQAYEVEGKYRFWGGMVTAFVGGGKALVDWHVKLAKSKRVEIYWSTPAISLLTDSAREDIVGVEVLYNGHKKRFAAKGGVILACGGFQASPSLRAQYLGPGWDLAHVRGCQYSTGDGHKMAMMVGAKAAGNYSGCHSVCWDANSPTHGGDRGLTNQFTKSGYVLGIMVNNEGKRFVDEGADFRNYTYAMFGKEVLKQPSSTAFQIWDSKGSKWLRQEEYADDVTINIRADTIEELADKLAAAGLENRREFLETVTNFNQAAKQFQQEKPEIKFDPAAKDGLSTQSSQKTLSLPKSNWAVPIEKGPFQAVKITCGITFTFGGIDAEPETACVISNATRQPIKGLYCVGELMGGLFSTNYPGGSGLTAGTVFGRIAGKHAALRCRRFSGA